MQSLLIYNFIEFPFTISIVEHIITSNYQNIFSYQNSIEISMFQQSILSKIGSKIGLEYKFDI